MFCWDHFPLAVLCRGMMAACFVTDPALPGLDGPHHLWHQAMLP
jgi:hypothetical protein